MSAGSIIIDLLMRTGSFETDTRRAERRLRQFKREAESVGRFLGTAFAAAATTVTVVFGAMVSRSREAIDSQAKLAHQLRTTYTSLETLTRAGDLAGISMQQIGVAGRQLEVNLGRASQGYAAQRDALEKLKVSADELAKLPLDQRILAVNKALQDNVKESERAAVAADLFGARNAAAILTLDPDTIAEAARQTAIFGSNLSDIDAAKVEQANDALSTINLAFKGFGDQLTVQLAPILKGIGDEFLNLAEEAGGMGNVVKDVFDGIITVAGFTADAVDGVRRVVEVLADAFIISINTSLSLVSDAFATFLEVLDKVPGIDFTETAASVRAFSDEAYGVVSEAWKHINETLEEPLPSEAFKQWVTDAQEAGEEAAKAAARARQDVPDQTTTDNATDPVGDLMKTLEAGFKEAQKYVDSTRTEVERLEEQIARVQVLAADGFFGPGVDQEVLDRLNLRLEEAKERLAALNEDNPFAQFTEFADQAARNLQDSFAEYLFDPFDQGLDGMLKGLVNTLRQMAAQAASSQILTGLFGGLAGSTNPLLKAIGGAFGGPKADGGGVRAGVSYLVGENEPEIFTPSTSGVITPVSSISQSRSVMVNQTLIVHGTTRAEQAAFANAIRAQTQADLADAFRRN